MEASTPIRCDQRALHRTTGVKSIEMPAASAVYTAAGKDYLHPACRGGALRAARFGRFRTRLCSTAVNQVFRA